MRVYKKGGQTDENPPKPAPAPDRLRSRGLPQQPQPELQMNTLGRLQQMMEAMQRSQAAPPRDLGPIPRRDDVIEYLANKYNMPAEDVEASMPEPVRAYIKPMAGGGGFLDEGDLGMFTKRTFSGEKRRNNPHGKRSISISSQYANNPLARGEELIHSMQDGNPFVGNFMYADLVDPILEGMEDIDNITTKDPFWASEIEYGFNPIEMEAKIMAQKMFLRDLGVIGQGELTEEDLDNMYLYANDMYKSDDRVSRETAYDMMRLFGTPQRKRFQDPEYRKALLNLYNKL